MTKMCIVGVAMAEKIKDLEVDYPHVRAKISIYMQMIERCKFWKSLNTKS